MLGGLQTICCETSPNVRGTTIRRLLTGAIASASALRVASLVGWRMFNDLVQDLQVSAVQQALTFSLLGTSRPQAQRNEWNSENRTG